MPGHGDFRINPSGWRADFESPNGIVGRDLYKRAKRVERAAKRDVGVDTGQLRELITTDVQIISRFGLHARVGTWREPVEGYSTWHHEGTRPHIIAARPGKHLQFHARGGAVVYRTAVRHPGTKPNRYLAQNLYLAGD